VDGHGIRPGNGCKGAIDRAVPYPLVFLDLAVQHALADPEQFRRPPSKRLAFAHIDQVMATPTAR